MSTGSSIEQLVCALPDRTVRELDILGIGPTSGVVEPWILMCSSTRLPIVNTGTIQDQRRSQNYYIIHYLNYKRYGKHNLLYAIRVCGEKGVQIVMYCAPVQYHATFSYDMFDKRGNMIILLYTKRVSYSGQEVPVSEHFGGKIACFKDIWGMPVFYKYLGDISPFLNVAFAIPPRVHAWCSLLGTSISYHTGGVSYPISVRCLYAASLPYTSARVPPHDTPPRKKKK